MDAPVYPPAQYYTAPERQPRLLSTHTTAIGDLMAIPAAWAICEKEIPGIAMIARSDFIKPHLGNFSFSDLAQFGLFMPEQLSRIDEQLKLLGAVR